MKRYRMKIQTLTPVHIGTGEDIAPFEYVLKDDVFYRIDLARFLTNLSPAQRGDFNKAVDSGNVIFMRKFIARNVDPEKYYLFRCFAHDAFMEIYRTGIDDPRNQLQVHLFTRQGEKAYLPGSSLKGAIRTAVVSDLARDCQTVPPGEYTDRRGNPSGSRLENRILGCTDPRDDPFRCLSIPDTYLPHDSTFIEQVSIHKPDRRTGPDPAGIRMFYEQTYCKLYGEEEIVAQAVISIDDRLPHIQVRSRQGTGPAVSRPLTAEQIIAACRDFYHPKLKNEDTDFYQGRGHLDADCRPLLAELDTLRDNECLMRLGRFSHVECVTLDDYRNPYGRRGWGKTRTLSTALDGFQLPMGWVRVSLEG